jgi:hypothetical protein
MAEKRRTIRIFGFLSLMIAFCFFQLCAARGPFAPFCATDVIIPGVVFSITGVGLLLLRRTAAVVFATISSSVGLWLVLGSLLEVPLPGKLVDLIVGGVTFSPGIAMITARKGFKGW